MGKIFGQDLQDKKIVNTRDAFESHTSDMHWKHARQAVFSQTLICKVKGCSIALLPFEEVRTRLHLHERLYCGVQDIELKHIRGSVGRYNDFTSEFLPLRDHMKERWRRVDRFVSEQGAPPIDVYQVGDAYFVVDGNHRVSVARQQGAEMIDARVWMFNTPAGLSANATMEEVLLKAEYLAFLEQTGLVDQIKPDHDIQLSIPGGFADLATQIKNYRHGLEAVQQQEISYGQAAVAWYGDVYLPAAIAIQESDVLEKHPHRTEGDLFIWAWRHLQELIQIRES